MFSGIFSGIKIFIVLTFVTGIVYPWVITMTGHLWFEEKINGSLIYKKDKVVGSELISQKFDSPNYFHGRPSASDYSAYPSGATNLGPTSSLLIQQVKERREKFRLANELTAETAIPEEMLFASGSGLDPHISLKSAELQMNRIAKTRNFTPDQLEMLKELITSSAEEPQFSFFGERRLNVLLLNLALDEIK